MELASGGVAVDEVVPIVARFVVGCVGGGFAIVAILYCFVCATTVEVFKANKEAPFGVENKLACGAKLYAHKVVIGNRIVGTTHKTEEELCVAHFFAYVLGCCRKVYFCEYVVFFFLLGCGRRCCCSCCVASVGSGAVGHYCGATCSNCRLRRWAGGGYGYCFLPYSILCDGGCFEWLQSRVALFSDSAEY